MRKVSQPVLILQGEVDQQVTMEQARMLERAAREAGNPTSQRAFSRASITCFCPQRRALNANIQNLRPTA